MMELLASLENSGFGTWLRESPSIWAYPAVLTLHAMVLVGLVGGDAMLRPATPSGGARQFHLRRSRSCFP